MAAPQFTIAKKDGANGILPISVSATKPSATKATQPRLKIVIRKLPPGLTRSEFEDALGPDWTLGLGQVDWMMYRPGKVSTDPAKLSRPSRAYLHLKDSSFLPSLSEKVRSTSFHDAAETWRNASISGPPSIEFAPFGRISNGKNRTDARQGMIDQDPEFIGFLLSLTDPIATKSGADSEATPKKEKVTTTPLVQYIKDKKASKGALGPSGRARHARTDSTKSDKSGEKPNHKSSGSSGSGRGSPEAKRTKADSKIERAAKDAVKILNREARTSRGEKAAAEAASPKNETPSSPKPPTGPAAGRRRERGNASAAAMILQRDLGIVPGPGGRRSRGVGKKVESGSPSSSPLRQSASLATKEPSAQSEKSLSAEDKGSSKSSNTDPKSLETVLASSTLAGGPPIILKNSPLATPTGPSASKFTRPLKRTQLEAPPGVDKETIVNLTVNHDTKPLPAPNQAFLKHANPSQGITELLIQEALEVYGQVNKVEIDKKKGFAYVDFGSRDALLAAIKASPVKVAQGQVQVLERLDKKGHSLRTVPIGGMRGGAGRGGRGGSNADRGSRGRGKGSGKRGGGLGGSSQKPASTTSSPAPTPAQPADPS